MKKSPELTGRDTDMSFTAIAFFIFLVTGLVLYYIVPKKARWCVLLILSYYYYMSFSVKTVVFLVFTTLVTYAGGRLLEKINTAGSEYLAANKGQLDRETKKAYKEKVKKKKRLVVACILVLAFGLLAVVKYTSFAIQNLNSLFASLGADALVLPVPAIILPLGISFYTFQSASYVIDIYNNKYPAEKNVFKYALFVSFFPQLLQGPIGRFDRLSGQLFGGNKFNLVNLQFGAQRILWGMLKKMVLADRVAGFVSEVFGNYTVYGGVYNIIAVLLYCVQLYADFSGGVDIVIGVAECFGIKMDENFRQPFFSKSVGEFWRRWHITLGAWMKDYIFYPFSLSKAMNRFGKWSKKIFGIRAGKALPICLANILIFFIVGVWHGAAWKFIVYGLYNGFIIAISALLEPLYEKMFAKTGIKKSSRAWGIFEIMRTFVLVNIGWYFDMAIGLYEALVMIEQTFTKFDISVIFTEQFLELGMGRSDFLIVLAGCLIIFVVSLMKEKGIKVREYIAAKPLVVRWAVWYLLILIIFVFGFTGQASAFMYANF